MLYLIKKKTFLTRIKARLFCVTGINCWAQKFPTQKVVTLPGQKITNTTQAQEEKEKHFLIVTKWTASDSQTFLILFITTLYKRE